MTPAFADQEPPLPTSSATKTILTAAHWGPMLVETDGENVLFPAARWRHRLPTRCKRQCAIRCTAKPACAIQWCVKASLLHRTSPRGVRGQDEFVRVSWEQALDLIDAQHRRIRDSYGPASILPAPTAGALTAYCIRRRRCCSAI